MNPPISSNNLCGLDLYGRGKYDASGITALAKALKVNAVLAKLDLESNDLRDAAKSALRAAAKPSLSLNGITIYDLSR